MAFRNKITNAIADAAPAKNWAHFKKNGCSGKGGKTTNSDVWSKYRVKETD